MWSLVRLRGARERSRGCGGHWVGRARLAVYERWIAMLAYEPPSSIADWAARYNALAGKAEGLRWPGG